MNTEPQTNPELDRLAIFIRPIAVAMMTNININGELFSRPMRPLLMDRQGAIWFFTNLRSSKHDHLDEINFSFSDASRAVFVSVSGSGELNTDATLIKSLWTPAARNWFADSPDSSNLALLKFLPKRAEYWNSPDCKLVRILTADKSKKADKIRAVSEHETLTNSLSANPVFKLAAK